MRHNFELRIKIGFWKSLILFVQIRVEYCQRLDTSMYYDVSEIWTNASICHKFCACNSSLDEAFHIEHLPTINNKQLMVLFKGDPLQTMLKRRIYYLSLRNRVKPRHDFNASFADIALLTRLWLARKLDTKTTDVQYSSCSIRGVYDASQTKLHDKIMVTVWVVKRV